MTNDTETENQSEAESDQKLTAADPGTGSSDIASSDATDTAIDAANAASATGGDDTPPDHLAISGLSEFHDADKLARGIGIRFKGETRTNIEEYCISESWVRVQAGKSLDRRGRPLTIKLSGQVEAWFEDLGDNPPVARKEG